MRAPGETIATGFPLTLGYHWRRESASRIFPVPCFILNLLHTCTTLRNPLHNLFGVALERREISASLLKIAQRQLRKGWLLCEDIWTPGANICRREGTRAP